LQRKNFINRAKSRASTPKTVKAPSTCSLIENPATAIKFFTSAEDGYRNHSAVVYDFTSTEEVTETFAAALIAHIKDRNINLGKSSKIIWPESQVCHQKLRKLGIFGKVEKDKNEIDLEHLQTQKLTNSKVQNQLAKEIVNSSSQFIYGETVRIKELYSILIEIMANTNNHADVKNSGKYPWWMVIFGDSKLDVVKFVLLDLGVGIFESLPVKKFGYRIQGTLPVLETQRLHLGMKINYMRANRLATIFNALSEGRINSSTQDPTRGRGIPRIVDCAKSGHFRKFNIITNDAFIDVVQDSVYAMDAHFSGTIYYFELKKFQL